MPLFCTTPFVARAESILKSLGDPGVQIIEVAHPLGGLVEDEVRECAEAEFEGVDHAVESHEAQT